VNVVSNVTFRIRAGEIFALAGESGCGKSVTCLALTRLLPESNAVYRGRVRLGDVDILTASEKDLRRARGRLAAYVFQEPGASLNPVLRIGTQLEECLRRGGYDGGQGRWVPAADILGEVGIPDPERCLAAYPHQLSGGMKQRVMLAMALAMNPRILIADEPTTALDVTIQAQILELIRRIRDRTRMAVLLVSHDFGVVAALADRVAVMYAGQIVEQGPAGRILSQPLHPYTRGLLRSIPSLEGPRLQRMPSIPGRVPAPWEYGSGCRFAPRCPDAEPACFENAPPLTRMGADCSVRCPIAVRKLSAVSAEANGVIRT